NGPRVMVAGTRDTMTRLGTARTIRLGSAELARPLIATLDLTPVQARIGYDVRGTIGYELFDKYVVTIDYAARTLTLFDPAAFVYSGTGVVLPMTLDHRIPVVDALVTTRTKGVLAARLHLDLGSSTYALRLSTPFVTAHDLERDTVTVTGPVGAGVGGMVIGSLLRLPRLTLGALVIERPSTALSRNVSGVLGAAAAVDGTVGAPVFRRATLILDYAHSRAIIEPHGRFDLPDSADASGLSLAMDPQPPHTLRVAFVIAGSAGEAAGVREGDEVLAIDGEAAAATAPPVALTIMRAKELLRAAGDTRHLTLRRGTDSLNVQLSLRPIY
ncbi:MAG TPA: PDZ domain-containing protein, partial [Gemmatimonadaceae bacterium]